MPAKSQSQQKAAGAALSAKRGDTKVGELKGASKSMYKSLSEKDVEDMASTARKGKPEHKSQAGMPPAAGTDAVFLRPACRAGSRGRPRPLRARGAADRRRPPPFP